MGLLCHSRICNDLACGIVSVRNQVCLAFLSLVRQAPRCRSVTGSSAQDTLFLSDIYRRIAQLACRCQPPSVHIMPGLSDFGLDWSTTYNVPVHVCRESFLHGSAVHSTTRVELQALFDVIGTPAWADLRSIQNPLWRSYLQRLPGTIPCHLSKGKSDLLLLDDAVLSTLPC